MYCVCVCVPFMKAGEACSSANGQGRTVGGRSYLRLVSSQHVDHDLHDGLVHAQHPHQVGVLVENLVVHDVTAGKGQRRMPLSTQHTRLTNVLQLNVLASSELAIHSIHS